jgi:SAM-dependent methyltransferase
MTAPPTDRASVWTRHWASGAAHSCTGSSSQRYDGEAGEFWRQRWAQLPAGARVLDLATGNGPLPRDLCAQRPAGDWQCDAVDLAQVAPSWLASLHEPLRSRLKFHAGTRMEALPFATGSMDCVVSQYGFEYAQREPAWQEVLRVLAPGGTAAFVMHHAQGRPVSLAREELQLIEQLTAPDGWLAATRALLEPLNRARTPAGLASLQGDTVADAKREAFQRTQQGVQQLKQTANVPDVLHEATHAVSAMVVHVQTEGLASALSAWEAYMGHLADQRLRLRELCDHALDAQALAWLCEAAIGGLPGHRVETGTITEQSALMGWTFWVRPAPS